MAGWVGIPYNWPGTISGKEGCWMPTYVTLVNFTEQGVKTFKDAWRGFK